MTGTIANAGAFGAEASLTEVECLEVLACRPCLTGRLCVQRDVDDRGHISLGLLSDAGAAQDKVFLLWREAGLLQLGHARGESYIDLGSHASMASVLFVVQAVIAGEPAGR